MRAATNVPQRAKRIPKTSFAISEDDRALLDQVCGELEASYAVVLVAGLHVYAEKLGIVSPRPARGGAPGALLTMFS